MNKLNTNKQFTNTRNTLDQVDCQDEVLENYLNKIFEDSISVKQKVVGEGHANILIPMAKALVNSFQQGGKLLICGNGGSAADAQHLAAELLIRLRPHMNRQSIPAISLAMDPSTLTACGNDFGFEVLYERMVQGLGTAKDVLLGITTSGRSANIIRALKKARELGIMTFGFLGNGGADALAHCDLAFIVPSTDVARIQEVHITAGHALMEMVEEILLEQDALQIIPQLQK